VNDSGFWLVNRYLGLSTSETLRSWTLMTAVVGLTGLAVVLLIGAVLGP
jgi:H+/gluconate symporter-like permease